MIGAALAAFLAEPAAAMTLICGEREAMRARLAHEFGEHRTGVGLAGDGNLLELYRDAEGDGSFTVMVVPPHAPGVPARACILATGRDWQEVFDPAVAVGKEL